MRLLRRIITSVFGNISWQPPGWIFASGRSLRKHRLAAGVVVLAMVLGGIGAWRGYEWYIHRPKPVKMTLHTYPIPETTLEKELHPAPITVYFNGSAAPINMIGKPVPTGIHLDPPAAGEWFWGNDRQLVFTPKNDWPANQKYAITIDKTAVAPHVLLERYKLETKTAPFTASIQKFEFYQDPQDPTVKEAVATLQFSHSVAPGELSKYITLAMLGGSPVFNTNGAPFTITYGPHNRLAYLTSAPLTLPEQEDFMKLTLSKKLATSQGGAMLQAGLEDKVRIPDVYSFFKIESTQSQIIHNTAGEPEQLIFVNTSAAARTEDIAKSLEIYLLPKKAEKVGGSGGSAGGDSDNDTATNGGDDSDSSDGDKSDSGDDDSDSNTEQEPDTAAPQQWQSPREVDDDVLKAAKRIPFTVVASDEENSTQHMFKIKIDSDGTLYLRIRKGVRALGDFKLGADYDTVVPVPQPPRDVVIQGDGGVLALNGERKVSVESRGVELIEYEIARIPADQINHLVSQTEGSFQNPTFVNENFDETNIARIATERQAINLQNHYVSNYTTFDFSSHLAPAADGGSPMQGLFFLQARAVDPKTKKYIENISARRFILVTDIGMLVKQNADGSRDVFLQSIKSRTPLAGVRVDVLARNGVPAVSGISGADGHVAFPALGKPAREKEPVAFVAWLGNDVSFMPFNRDDRQLDFSRFNVDGIQSVTGNELQAFVFTERGVYRPGDPIHVAFSVKQHNWGGSLAGIPVETEVVDARGTSAQVQKMALPASGVAEFGYQTAYESPTGDYTFNVYLVRNGKRGVLLGSAGALVKEFLPDRMKIDSQLSSVSPHGWILPKDVHATVTLRNLYGTAATNRRIVSKMTLDPTGFGFDEYPDYVFYDRLLEANKDLEWQSIELGEQTTDENGTVNVDLDLERFTAATYRLHFFAEGFEAEGGRSVNAFNSTLVSPLPYVVGYKSPDGNLGYLKVNSQHSIELVAIDNTLKKIAVSGLELSVIEKRFVSVLQKKDDGTYAYVSVPKDIPVVTQDAAIPADGFQYTLPTDKAGNYCVELREKDSKNCVSKCEFSVVGDGDVSRSLDRNAELSVKLNRDEYNAGDDIEVSITAPYTGSGLITIERDKVYAYQWFQADATSSIQHIRLPEGFDGTGYVNVSFIRSLDSKEIYMSPLSYAVVPFTANREKRRLKIDLECAKEVKPGEPLNIVYKTDRPAKIVVYAVDEGILQVTGYELPDPLDFYFSKYALMVKTSQIVDLIMPEYSILRSSAFGGDGEAKHLNPFKRVTDKPVVFWSGVIDADPRERQVVYNVPDYFDGTLKVMAVALSTDAVGSVEEKTLVRGPFVITPGVPTLAAPGDQFEVGVTVANNVTGSGDKAEVTLTAEPSEQLEIVKTPAQPMIIPEGKEVSAVFVVRAKEKPGAASLTFKAAANGEESTLRSTLSVRPATPLMTDVQSGNFTKDSLTVPVKGDLLPEYRHLESVVSCVPLGLARGLDEYLKNYPNGCSEQITSGAFCRLVLSDDGDFQLPRAELFKQLEYVFSVERSRQNDQGAFGLWTAGPSGGIDFVSTYVMDFLIEAKNDGFMPPADVFQSGLRHLQAMVVIEPNGLAEARTEAYAIYLLTREQVITTNYILNLEDYLDKNYPKQWRNDLTGVYLAGALSILKKDKEAQKLIDAFHMGGPDRGGWYDFYEPLGADSQYIEIVSRQFPEVLKRVTAKDFEAITGPIGRGEFNTLSAAYAVMALKSFSQHMAENPPALGITEIAKDKHETEISGEGKLLRRGDFSGDAASLRFAATPAVPGMGAFYQVIQTGFDRQLPTKPVADGLEIYRELLGSDNKVTHTAVLGQALTVRLVIRSISGAPVTNVAIVDLLPGGFEVVGSSLAPGAGSAGCDYVDVREDRAVFYTSVDTTAKVIQYQIKPCNRGQFVVPPVFAESMYNRAIKARGVADRIGVVDTL